MKTQSQNLSFFPFPFALQDNGDKGNFSKKITKPFIGSFSCHEDEIGTSTNEITKPFIDSFSCHEDEIGTSTNEITIPVLCLTLWKEHTKKENYLHSLYVVL